MEDNLTAPPIRPVNGRVLVEQLPYKPSKSIEVTTHDKADECEGIVVALSEHRYGRRYLPQKGWEHTGAILPWEIKVGDRVLFPPTYQDEDVLHMGGKKYRSLNSWDIVAVIDKPQPTGFIHPLTGENLPDAHPIHIFGA